MFQSRVENYAESVFSDRGDQMWDCAGTLPLLSPPLIPMNVTEELTICYEVLAG